MLVADGTNTSTTTKSANARIAGADDHVPAVGHGFNDQRRSGPSDVCESDHGWRPAPDCHQLLAHLWFAVPAGDHAGSMQRY